MDDVLPPGWRQDSVAVPSRADGFVARLDARRLLRLAERLDLVVVLDVRPGDHVVRGDRLGRLWSAQGPDALDDDETADGLREAVVVQDTRTPQQDLRYGVQQLAEIAVRALSPGTNDPFTAMNDLAASLSMLAGRRPPSPIRLGAEEQVRLVAPAVHLNEVLADLFALIRCYALDAPSVLHRAVDLALAVGSRSEAPATRLVLDAELAALQEAFARRGPHSMDLEPFTDHVRDVRHRLTATDSSAVIAT